MHLQVQGKGNDAIIEALTDAGALLKREQYPHKYPYDWRTKKPTIFRATDQVWPRFGPLPLICHILPSALCLPPCSWCLLLPFACLLPAVCCPEGRCLLPFSCCLLPSSATPCLVGMVSIRPYSSCIFQPCAGLSQESRSHSCISSSEW